MCDRQKNAPSGRAADCMVPDGFRDVACQDLRPADDDGQAMRGRFSEWTDDGNMLLFSP